MGLDLDQKSFYNLQRKESVGQVSDQEQARLLLAYLEQEGYYIAVDEAYRIFAILMAIRLTESL
jgi:hypothetical protein